MTGIFSIDASFRTAEGHIVDETPGNGCGFKSCGRNNVFRWPGRAISMALVVSVTRRFVSHEG